MDTAIQEPFAPNSDAPQASDPHPAQPIPYGLKDGRMWLPTEVEPGRRCGCICPACERPLWAKAQKSVLRRPYFAHEPGSDCAYGYETALHERAKQLIADHGQIMLPAWQGAAGAMPNPPKTRDRRGNWHEGRCIEFPATTVNLTDVSKELPRDGYTPDVTATDGEGQLLIEIRVTHAVDEIKAQRVIDAGDRMMEIDLSYLHRHTHDPAAFEHAVLHEASNRKWISYPRAVADWKAARDELLQQVADLDRARDVELERYRWGEPIQTVRPEESRKQAQKDWMREQLRLPHARALEVLSERTDQGRVSLLRKKQADAAMAKVRELAKAVPPQVLAACTRHHFDAWIYGVDATLWQLMAYKHFVGSQQVGFRFNQRDVAQWLRRSFDYDRELWSLFNAQYQARSSARQNGYSKRRIACWFFSDEENGAIPNYYAPVNAFAAQLQAIDTVYALPDIVGELEVQKPASEAPQ